MKENETLNEKWINGWMKKKMDRKPNEKKGVLKFEWKNECKLLNEKRLIKTGMKIDWWKNEKKLNENED